MYASQDPGNKYVVYVCSLRPVSSFMHLQSPPKESVQFLFVEPSIQNWGGLDEK